MFFRILALLPLVFLVTAHSLVSRSDVVVPVCNAISNMNTTAIALQNACTNFEAQPTNDMAMPIMKFGFALEGEISSGINVCPSDVLSSGDTEILFNALKDLYDTIQKLVSSILKLKDAIIAAGYEAQSCFAVEMMATSMTTFMDKVYACSANEYKGPLDEMRSGVLTMMAQANFSYCGTVSPRGSSKISGVEI
ncbi:uncharacterized protein ARMOST_19505 [Armillaria ostoyae]|uniref:Cell wall galactomannoprotein n=1 Tax=Armillaria ostoyae TaxID=47428 RepID=MP1_ARMOS|nr:RecName: Full=Cell wall galactomannoprotein; Flags: Precursor [Armillaria ostoyae]SJL15991.1 uncharacterized protein ARMOST_19505 [Armillaria ostoyae]